ncbi:MAG: cyclase family protein [Calditrichia bacterium]
MKKFYDISLSLSEGIPAWPGDPSPKIIQTASLNSGDIANSSRLESSLHWGTHVDAPYHLNPEGWRIDQIPPEILLGPVQVVELPDEKQITAASLRKKSIPDTPRIIFKTRNSQYWHEKPLRFHPEFTALTADAAVYLLERNIKLVGIDYLSLDLFAATDLPVHRLLYRENVIGVEGLDLQMVSEGEYYLICLPLKVAGGDGAPARVLLQEIP